MKKLMLIAACLVGVPAAVFALDDEPDGLSWELFSQDRNILLHFYDWAKANPPPVQTSQTSQTSGTSQTFPYVWIKPCELPFVELDCSRDPSVKGWEDAGWTTNSVAGEPVLRFKRYTGGSCYQTFEVPEDGTYRFWIRYRHQQGLHESNLFRLTPALDEAHPEADDGSAVMAVFEQMFARANEFRGGIKYTRPRNPVPQISDVETPKGGAFIWEATHKTAFLKKGKYTARFCQRVVTTPRGDIAITDYALIGDPFFSPEGMMRTKSEAGRLPVPAETKSPLYAIRPGADMDNASPALKAWWNQWRQALYAKLVAAEHSKDYVWGTLASLPALDEMLNTVDRISKFKSIAERNAQMPDTYKMNADEFDYTGNWEALTGRYDKVSCAHALFINGLKDGRCTYELDVKRAGTYYLHTLIYQSHILKGNYRGAMRVSVRTKDGEAVGYIVGAGDGTVVSGDEKLSVEDGVVKAKANEGNARRKSLWNASKGFGLPAGKATITVETVFPPWAPQGCRKIWGRIFCRAVLTARPDFNPAIEHETPWGDRIGTDDIGFWLSPDPWTAFSRYSPLATGKYAETIGEEHFRRYDWTPIDAKEINCARHDIEAAAGEVVSELLIIRNNTEKTLGAEPKLSGDLPAKCRLIAWCPAPDGEYVPRFLLSRTRIALPAHQNTALWVNIDCRGAKEGTYPVKLAFAGRAHAWNVTVKGSIEGVPNPYAFPWAQPSYRKSCWELYRDLGFNVISAREDRKFEFLSKSAAEKYGIRLIRENLGRVKDDYQDRVRANVADWKRRGFGYTDFCYIISDEPGFGAMTNWVKVAKTIKAADPKAHVWCNTGFFPDEKQWDDCQEFMSLWDVFCPFWHAFIMRPNRDADHLKSYQKLGNPRLGYITPSTSIYWIADGANDSLWFAEECRNHGRDGWSVVRMGTNDGWDIDHPVLQAIFEGAWGRTLTTRYAEAAREANQRWRKAAAK